MALCRCKEHKPERTKIIYTHFAEPIGFPNTSSICGRSKCRNSGFIWLDKHEENEFQNGERIFKYPSAASKVKVSENIKPKIK